MWPIQTRLALPGSGAGGRAFRPTCRPTTWLGPQQTRPSVRIDIPKEVAACVRQMHVKRGLIRPPTAEPVQLDLRDLPPRCAREFIDPIKKKLEASTIKKEEGKPADSRDQEAPRRAKRQGASTSSQRWQRHVACKHDGPPAVANIEGATLQHSLGCLLLSQRRRLSPGREHAKSVLDRCHSTWQRTGFAGVSAGSACGVDVPPLSRYARATVRN